MLKNKKLQQAIDKATSLAVAKAVEGLYESSFDFIAGCDTDMETVGSVCSEQLEAGIKDAATKLFTIFSENGKEDRLIDNPTQIIRCWNCEEEMENPEPTEDGIFTCDRCN